VALHLAPDRVDELTAQLVAVEAAFWATTASHQRSVTLADLVAEATEQLGLDVGGALIDEATTRHLDAWTPHIHHDREAAATLAALRRRGLRTALLSNTHWPRTFHDRFLDRDGLAELLDARLYTCELSFQKPHPSAFGAALEALGSPDPTRVVFVGDRPWDDIAGAQRAGMITVLRPNPLVPAFDVEPDAVIAALPELVDLIDRWRGG